MPMLPCPRYSLTRPLEVITVTCSTCATANPDVASFCHKCGTPLRTGAATRTYAVQTSENVNQFALISTIMPHTNRDTADSYRWAMILSAVLILSLIHI